MEIIKQLTTTITLSGIIAIFIGASIKFDGHYPTTISIAALLHAFVQLDRMKSITDLDGPVHQVFFAQIIQPFLLAGLAVLGALKIYSIEGTANIDVVNTIIRLAMTLGIICYLVSTSVMSFRATQAVWYFPGVTKARKQNPSTFWMLLIILVLFAIHLVSLSITV